MAIDCIADIFQFIHFDTKDMKYFIVHKTKNIFDIDISELSNGTNRPEINNRALASAHCGVLTMESSIFVTSNWFVGCVLCDIPIWILSSNTNAFSRIQSHTVPNVETNKFVVWVFEAKLSKISALGASYMKFMWLLNFDYIINHRPV